jgi:hypothetical protein
MEAKDNPSTPSLAAQRLAHDWETIRTIRKGAKAIREAGRRFLIPFPGEEDTISGDTGTFRQGVHDSEYQRRLKSAPWRPEFVDCVATLAAKPFTKEVTLAEGANTRMQAFAENIDGRGNNLHVFAKDTFEGGVSMGAHGILVDFPSGQGARTVAEERALGVRPYWVAINADDILELTTEQRGGRKVVTCLRIREGRIQKEGFEQTFVPLIREIRADGGQGVPGTWKIWREETNATSKKKEWVLDKGGVMTLDEVPFVFYATNDIEGDQYVKPPLLDVADMQVELYNALSKKEQAYTITASPMLTANGMSPPTGDAKIQTGPGRVLFAPGAEGINTSWDYIQPNAANLKEIREDIREIIEDIRRLGMQPMTSAAGNTPALAFAFDGEKSFTILQSWALGLKDALEQAFVFTARWLNEDPASAPSVMVHTDWTIGLYGNTELQELNKARFEGQITQKTYLEEMQRRGVLGPQVDIKKELTELAKEAPAFDPANAMDQSGDDSNDNDEDEQSAA